MENVLYHVSERSSHLTSRRRKKIGNFYRLVRVSYYTTLGYDVIHGVFVLSTFVTVEVI